ncbi:high-potential iron-sulfur protein [Paraburkholderia bannensis]|uniref:high-potential iron-sulfur protein n=1 Tax=Paraburkholderia bannensis TaxID=765414 RepID=UPI002ABE03F8|nr:high-potential iron-sulfur protein [Paraburkholderia bannensis]
MDLTRQSRRTFLIASASTLVSLPLARTAYAEAPLVAEADPAAQALGYRADAKQVDKAKFARYSAGQDCGNCTFYQGKPSDAAANCPLFGGKRVAAAGWCNGYNKKA